jgi:DNA-binding GntR family transcriptional regulator
LVTEIRETEKRVRELTGDAAAEQVRGNLRRDILSGRFLPGTRLKEHFLAEEYQVSRNTVRDGLRLLSSDGLVVTQRNAGSTVRMLSEEDARDIYAVRRALEIPAALASATATAADLQTVRQACAQTMDAAERDAWSEVGTSSLLFHQSIVALHGSDRLTLFFENILAQLRLVFFVMPNEPEFQKVWPVRDVEIADLLIAGQREAAAAALQTYLLESEALIVDAIRHNATLLQRRGA